MATFNQLTDKQLQDLGERLIRNVKNRVSQQVPLPGRNPFAKGNLARSVSYSWVKREDMTWDLHVNYEDYGRFTNFGTRKFYNRNMEAQNVFGYEFRGYQRAKGGVRPQGWLSLRGDQPVYEAIVEAEVRLTWEEFVKNTVTPLSQTNTTTT